MYYAIQGSWAALYASILRSDKLRFAHAFCQCPRCIENDVECTTTPVVRKARGTAGTSRKKQRAIKEGPAAASTSSNVPSTACSSTEVSCVTYGSDTISVPQYVPILSAQEQLVLAMHRNSLVDHLLDCTSPPALSERHTNCAVQ